MVIDSWENGQYKEIWVYAKEGENDERALCGLINGELDYFPLSYVLPTKQVMEALEYYFFIFTAYMVLIFQQLSGKRR